VAGHDGRSHAGSSSKGEGEGVAGVAMVGEAWLEDQEIVVCFQQRWTQSAVWPVKRSDPQPQTTPDHPRPPQPHRHSNHPKPNAIKHRHQSDAGSPAQPAAAGGAHLWQNGCERLPGIRTASAASLCSEGEEGDFQTPVSAASRWVGGLVGVGCDEGQLILSRY